MVKLKYNLPRGRGDITKGNQTHLSMHTAMRCGMPTFQINLNILPISVAPSLHHHEKSSVSSS
jgi:hypothetical protein